MFIGESVIVSKKKKGTLIIIGGHEDKDGNKVILEEITRRVNDGCLVLVTAATEQPEEMAAQYTETFIDTHFAERGRIGRILGVVAQNPRNLGIGIDEDTAIVAQDGTFSVLGSGAVYVADGSPISYNSLSENRTEGIVSIFDVKLHVLGSGDSFNLKERKSYSTEPA